MQRIISMDEARIRLAVLATSLRDPGLRQSLVQLFKRRFATLAARGDDVAIALAQMDDVRVLLAVRSACRDDPALMLDVRIMTTIAEVTHDVPRETEERC